MNIKDLPKVVVLMATFNGRQWIVEQVASILEQRDVEVRLIISDDLSTDGTVDLLHSIAQNDYRVTVLPFNEKFGSAAKNFYRLIVDAEIGDCDYVAFADQDDIWLKNKLSRLVKVARDNGADGVSSNVVAFWADGKRALIDKSQTIRKLDFIFESAGPGSTYLMTPWLIQQVKTLLNEPSSNACKVEYHDWLVYAICRTFERKWVVSTTPTVKYRQHNANEIGANVGIKAAWDRFKKVRSGWYKSEVVKISEISRLLTSDMFVKNACFVIAGKGVLNKIKLLKLIHHSRRSLDDRVILGLAVLLDVF